MSISSDSAEQMTRMMLEGTEVTLKITGEGAKELLAIIYAILKDNTKTKGKTTLTNLLKSGKELKVFTVKKDELATFIREAKRYGILYSAIVNKEKDDGIVDIMVRTEDASKINRIVERFKLSSVDTAKIKSIVNNIPLQEKDPKSQLENSLSTLKMQEKDKPKVGSIRGAIEEAKKEVKIINSAIKDKVIDRGKDEK